ncbi:MAG: 16S rRNA (guanine(966)-N(2))-methyltransferase RsmD [Steroidobacteraceae bacterium]
MNTRRAKSATNKSERHPDTVSGANRLRIIGGRWRGTRLIFPDIAAIRPTPDRVRETLFNWLQQEITDAHCLDLFAGSGALGLEALSRGAQSVTFVDQEPQIAHYLRATLTRLKCDTATVHSGDARSYLQKAGQTFELVFLDPPFATVASGDWLANLLKQLDTSGCLSPHAWIYLECPASLGSPTTWVYWPKHWRLHRSRQAGQVGYHLVRRTVDTLSA